MRDGWVYKKLGEVCEIISGSTPKTNNPDYWDGNYNWVTPADLNGNKYQGATKRKITEEGAKSCSLTLLPVGTVLLSSRAPIGKVAITTEPMYCNQGFKNLDCTDEILNEYLFYALIKNVPFLQELGKGATFKEISKKDVSDYIIPLPPLSVQQSIVSELDKLSELIDIKKKQMEDYDNLAKSLFNEMFGDPVENEMGWEVKKLGEVCETITDGDHMPPPKSDTGIPFITISDIEKDTRKINFEKTFYVPQTYFENLKDSRRVQKGDLLYTVTGSYGIPIIVKTDNPFCFQRHIALIRPQKSILLTEYLCYWALCDAVKWMADKVATGIAQKTVGLNSIRNFKIILPPLSLQQSFATKIERIERQKSTIERQLSDLQTLLASRMQYWFD